jgi:hypothetical protein
VAEFQFLSLDRAQFEPIWKAATGHDPDPEAVAAFREYWRQFDDMELVCFLCDREVKGSPLTAQVLPDLDRADRLLGAPLCEKCWQLPPMLRLNRCLRLLKRIKSRPGRHIAFQFGPQRQPHPR